MSEPLAMRRSEEGEAWRWASVAQIVMDLGEELSVESLGQRALQQAADLLGADATAIYLISPPRLNLTLLTQYGYPADFAPAVEGLDPDADALATTASRSVGLRLFGEVTALPASWKMDRELMLRHGFRRLAAAPLRVRGQIVGVMTLAFRSATAFDGSEQGVIDVIAHTVAAGILNARALSDEHRMRRALQAVDEATLGIAAELDPARVLQAIVDGAREVTGARYAALGIGTERDKPFEPWVFSGLNAAQEHAIGRHPRPVGLLGAVPEEDAVIRIPDLASDPRYRGWPPHHPPMRSFLGMPIRSRGGVIGNLYLTDKIDAEEFTEEDERAVASLAAHAAIAYRHAQLYQQAQRERNRLDAVVKSSPLGIIFVERETGHTYANPAAETILGRPISIEAGREQYLEHFTWPDGTPVALEEVPSHKALRGELVVGVELVLARPDGKELTLLVNAAPIGDGDSGITGAVVLWQDISPLKLERLREEFISVVAHELRAPITVIAGYADLLSRGEHPEREERAIASIRVSTRRLDRLVRDLLDVSRIEARRLHLDSRPLDLAGLTKDVVARVKGLMGSHPVSIAMHGDVHRVEADPDRIEQVLTNLLTNAAKYSTPNSKVRIDVEAVGGEAIVSVANEGQGIPAEDLPRLFTRFYRTGAAERGKAPGLGLGLYIARGLIEAQGGRIWATSEPRKGAVFSFALPLLTS